MSVSELAVALAGLVPWKIVVLEHRYPLLQKLPRVTSAQGRTNELARPFAYRWLHPGRRRQQQSQQKELSGRQCRKCRLNAMMGRWKYPCRVKRNFRRSGVRVAFEGVCHVLQIVRLLVQTTSNAWLSKNGMPALGLANQFRHISGCNLMLLSAEAHCKRVEPACLHPAVDHRILVERFLSSHDLFQTTIEFSLRAAGLSTRVVGVFTCSPDMSTLLLVPIPSQVFLFVSCGACPSSRASAARHHTTPS